MVNASFPLNVFCLPHDIETVVEEAWSALGSWRSFVICVDGRCGVGKSVLARYLSFRLNSPCIHSDDYLLGNGKLKYHQALEQAVGLRLQRNMPLIYDGVFAADTISKMGISAGYIVRVASVDQNLSERWKRKFKDYEVRFPASREVYSLAS